MNNLFITGADGFIGSHLTEALIRQGHNVRAFVMYNSFNSWGWLDHCSPDVKGQFDVFAGDIRDPHGVKEAMKGCDAVLHLAALIAIPYSYHSPDTYVDTNIKGTLNVMQAARELGVKRVIHTSTSEVYGTARFVPITEEHPLQGQSPYSATKIAADQLAYSFHASFGLPVVIARPFNTYGPRQSARAVIPTIITQIANGKRQIKLGAVSPTRDFNYVQDTVAGFIAALNSDKGLGEVVNFGSNFEISVGDTAQLIAEAMNVEIEIITDEARLRPENSEVERLWADNVKAKQLFGWQPSYGGREGFKRGLTETAEWFARPDNLRGYKADIYNMSSQTQLPSEVVTAIRAVVGAGPVALHEPSFNGNEWSYLKECLDSTFVSSVGKFVDRFELGLAKFTGSRHAVAVVNGTAALHIALKLAGVQGGDEVLVPALTFIATTNAVTYCNATPHFVDSEGVSLGIDACKLRDYLLSHTEQRAGQCVNRATGRVIRAIVPMHTFGHPVDVDGLLAVAHDFNVALVEDAAESLGSTYHGRHTGTFGLMGTLSFNGNKTITTGGGGAILTNDAALARHAKHLTTTAKLPHAWEYRHDEIGYNYRLPNLNAALGCAQLEQLPTMLAAKRKLFARYQTAFAQVMGVKLIAEPNQCQSNYWLQTLLLDDNQSKQRDAILQATNDAGFMTRPAWVLMHELAPFKDCPRMDLSVGKSLSQRLINIPSSSSLVSVAP